MRIGRARIAERRAYRERCARGRERDRGGRNREWRERWSDVRHDRRRSRRVDATATVIHRHQDLICPVVGVDVARGRGWARPGRTITQVPRVSEGVAVAVGAAHDERDGRALGRAVGSSDRRFGTGIRVPRVTDVTYRDVIEQQAGYRARDRELESGEVFAGW